MSKVIVFCGLSGTGKTTLSELVSHELDIFCLHKDAMKERLYDSLSGATIEDSRRIGKAVTETVQVLAEDAIRNGVDIMIESPFNHQDNVDRFRQWAEKYDIDLAVIVCEVAEEDRQRRFGTRVRHPGHHDKERALHHDDFDYSQMPGRKLFVDTSVSQEESVQKILDFVRS